MARTSYGWKTPFNAKPDTGEVNDLPHETIPDQSLSPKEILDRHARGLPIMGQKVPIYYGEDEFPDVLRMDISERMELLQTIKAGIATQQKELQEQQKQEEAKALERQQKEQERQKKIDELLNEPKPKD